MYECVSECGREASTMRRAWPTGGSCVIKKNWNINNNKDPPRILLYEQCYLDNLEVKQLVKKFSPPYCNRIQRSQPLPPPHRSLYLTTSRRISHSLSLQLILMTSSYLNKYGYTCILFLCLIFVVPSIMLYSSEISRTRCNNCVFILRNGFTLHVSGDNLTHHQEYICCIWPQASRLT